MAVSATPLPQSPLPNNIITYGIPLTSISVVDKHLAGTKQGPHQRGMVGAVVLGGAYSKGKASNTHCLHQPYRTGCPLFPALTSLSFLHCLAQHYSVGPAEPNILSVFKCSQMDKPARTPPPLGFATVMF